MNAYRLLSLVLFLLISCMLQVGCIKDSGTLEYDAIVDIDDNVETQPFEVFVDIDPETNETVIELPDGTITNDFDEYATAIDHIYVTTPDAEITIVFGENINTLLTNELNPELNPERWGPYTINSYVLTGGFHTGWVSCFNRYIRHYDMRVHQNGNQLIGLHIAFWYQGGALCYGVYNSGSVGSFCRTGCSPTYSQVRNSVRDALVVIGISATVAYAIAQVLTPVAVGAMAVAL